jgi:hypothetical protein
MMPLNVDFVESFDKETIIAELRRIADLLDKSTLSRKDIDTHGRLSSSVVLKRFGSLRKALQEAGLTPSRFNKATDEELCLILIELWTRTLEKYGRGPYKMELGAFGYRISPDTFTRRFGSWRKALLAAAESSASGDEDRSDAPASPEGQVKTEGRKALSVRKRFLVFKRDRYRCRICGRSGVELEVDHVLAVAQGGTDRLDNLQTLCFDCNRGKRQSLE